MSLIQGRPLVSEWGVLPRRLWQQVISHEQMAALWRGTGTRGRAEMLSLALTPFPCLAFNFFICEMERHWTRKSSRYFQMLTCTTSRCPSRSFYKRLFSTRSPKPPVSECVFVHSSPCRSGKREQQLCHFLHLEHGGRPWALGDSFLIPQMEDTFLTSWGYAGINRWFTENQTQVLTPRGAKKHWFSTPNNGSSLPTVCFLWLTSGPVMCTPCPGHTSGQWGQDHDAERQEKDNARSDFCRAPAWAEHSGHVELCLKAGFVQEPCQERLFILILQRDMTCPRPQCCKEPGPYLKPFLSVPKAQTGSSYNTPGHSEHAQLPKLLPTLGFWGNLRQRR